MRLSEAFEDGQALLEAAREQGLEGVIAKRADSRYLPGRRTRDWLKVKTRYRQEFVIAGYTRGKGRRVGTLGSLVLGMYDGNGCQPGGCAAVGFRQDQVNACDKSWLR